MNSQKEKTFIIQTEDWSVPVEVKRNNHDDEYGYVILLHYSVDTISMRTPWDEMTSETVRSDIDLATRRSYLCFASMQREINKLKTRDLFGLASEWSSEERQQIFKTWYSPEARRLTHCFQFPLLRGHVSRRFPNGSIKIPGQKCSVDHFLMV